MASITITYLLSEAGRKANLLAGGSGRCEQTDDVRGDPGDAGARGRGRHGAATLDCTRGWYVPSVDEVGDVRHEVARPVGSSGGSGWRKAPEWDTPQTAESLLSWEVARLAGLHSALVEARAQARSVTAQRATERAEVIAHIQADPTVLISECQRDSYGVAWTYHEVARHIDRIGNPERVPELSTAVAVATAEAKLRTERAGAERDRKLKEIEAANAAKVAAAHAERAAWVQVHGSERLRLALTAGLLDSSIRAYEAERLAVERPGWEFDTDERVKIGDIRNPNEKALRALLEARAVYGESVQLCYARLHVEDDEDGPERDLWKGVVLYDQEYPIGKAPIMKRL